MTQADTDRPTAGRVLVVTGGGRGIGAAIVRLAAGRGYAVCFSYHTSVQAAQQLEAEVNGSGHRVLAFRGDASDPAAVKEMFDVAERELGRVTDLVNNAGVTGRIGPFRDVQLATLRRVVDVNVLGPMLCSQEAVRRWLERGVGGNIVNLSSIAATLGAPGEFVHYATTKAAIDALTIGLGKELATSGVRVNAVAPGTVFTDIHAAAGEPDRPARVVSRVPMGRIGEPNEIAAAVMWLLSEEASYVTGAVLRVSGGL